MQVSPSAGEHKLGKKLLTSVHDQLRRSGINITTRTIVDVTIIGAPSSTKNQDGKRDPELHQTAKEKRWYFGMKAHIGVDSRTKLVHTVLASAANVADCLALLYLLHGKERRVWGDQAYRGQKAAIRAGAPRAKDFTNQRYRWGKRIDESVKATNRRKSSVRAKVEHVFGVIKRVFGFQNVCYRGLANNLHRREVSAALESVLFSQEIAQCVAEGLREGCRIWIFEAATRRISAETADQADLERNPGDIPLLIPSFSDLP